MDARSFKKILVLLGILFFSLPMMIQPAIAENIPAGVIVMWSGSVSDIPPGWALCDGSNGTPNLRGRFILATHPGQNPGGMGGSEYHNHYVYGTNTLTSWAGAHIHEMGLPSDRANVEDGHGDLVADQNHTHAIASSGNHAHSIEIPGKHTDTSYHYPPYYYLAFIMRLPSDPGCPSISVVSSFTFPTDPNLPHGLAFDGTNLWAIDRHAHDILKLNAAGEVIDSIDISGLTNCPLGLTYFEKCFWFVGENLTDSTPTIFAVDLSGKLKKSFPVPEVPNHEGSPPTGLTNDGKYLWVASFYPPRGFIRQVSTSGALIKVIEAPGGTPEGLAFDGEFLWNVDYDNNMIYKLDTSGNVLCSFKSPGDDPIGATFDGRYLWVAVEVGKTIYKIDIGR